MDEHGLSVEEFNKLKNKPVKTQAENDTLKSIRSQIPDPTNTTTMRKVIPNEYVNGMIDNPDYSNPSGFMTDKSYVENITNIDDIIESSRLDYKDSLFKTGGDYVYIDFTSDNIGSIDIPYSTEFGGTASYPSPFSGSGFTAGRNVTIVPEWTGNNLTPNSGSTIHQVINGTDTIVANWDSGLSQWVRIN